MNNGNNAYCHACQKDVREVIGIVEGGFGRMCPNCNTPLAAPIVPVLPSLLNNEVDDGQRRMRTQPLAPPPQDEPARLARPSLVPRQAPTRPTLAASSTLALTPIEIVRARLDAVDVEVAQLRVETARMRGLETEAKHLRKMLVDMTPSAKAVPIRPLTPADGPADAEPTIGRGAYS